MKVEFEQLLKSIMGDSQQEATNVSSFSTTFNHLVIKT